MECYEPKELTDVEIWKEIVNEINLIEEKRKLMKNNIIQLTR